MQFKRSSSRVSTGAHSCMLACEKISKLLSFTGDVCLLIINAHRYLARSHADPPPLHPPKPSHTLTHTRSSSQRDELSVPVRLGILVSTRFGSPFRGAELGTFSPSVFQKSSEQQAKTDRTRAPRTFHYITELVFNHLLKCVPRCVRFEIHSAPQMPPQIIVPRSRFLQDHPRAYQRTAVGGRNQAN